MSDTPRRKRNLLGHRIARWYACLLEHWRIALALVGAMGVGAAAFASWITIIEHTNHTEFCITCHVMGDTVYPEYKKSSHFSNKHGFAASCPDCHVPQYSWIDEALAKVGTVGELYAFFFQGMDQVENFNKIRPELAKHQWAKFEATNARECRHCHDYNRMVLDEQKPSARVSHVDAAKKNTNCVQCHHGITHKLFEEAKPAAPANDSFDVD